MPRRTARDRRPAPSLTRRAGLGLLAAACCARPARAGPGPPRLVALDWAVAETLVALGHPPLAAAEIPSYDRTVVVPPMPAGVVDVGLRLSPNAELMQALRPDRVLINPAQGYLREALAPFGAVETVPIYTAAGEPLRLAGEAAMRLADLNGDRAAGAALIARTEAAMAAAAGALGPARGRPVYVIGFLDARHVAVAGRAGLFQGVLDRLGLRNAWTGPANAWGTAQVGLEALAAEPDACILYRAPIPRDAERTLASSPFWSRLPAVRAGRVTALPPLWPYGGLPTAARFAGAVATALTGAPPRG